MTKFVLNVVFPNTDRSANGKAKADATDILTTHGFERLNVPLLRGKEKITPKNLLKIRQLLRQRLSSDDVLLIQYPTNIGFVINNMILRVCKSKCVRTIALIHDVDSLRVNSLVTKLYKNIKSEVRFLNKFNYIVSSNDRMTAYLAEHGLLRPTVSLRIFDYLTTASMPVFKIKDKVVNFAGNLYKSEFLIKYNQLSEQTIIELFGQNLNNQVYDGNLKYNGSYSPNDIVKELVPGLGLIWDGASVDSCDGAFGRYLLYNNPHKTSLYLAAGLPVIVWRKAAIAQFVIDEQVGLTIDSLADLDSELKRLSVDELMVMHTRAQHIGKRLRNGYYLKIAIDKALKGLDGND
ncbi:hypothetical protein CJP55_04005 [Lactobacillus plantarum]|nr:hypothetical protein [Lactiplantibacillus plantarum]